MFLPVVTDRKRFLGFVFGRLPLSRPGVRPCDFTEIINLVMFLENNLLSSIFFFCTFCSIPNLRKLLNVGQQIEVMYGLVIVNATIERHIPDRKFIHTQTYRNACSSMVVDCVIPPMIVDRKLLFGVCFLRFYRCKLNLLTDDVVGIVIF